MAIAPVGWAHRMKPKGLVDRGLHLQNNGVLCCTSHMLLFSAVRGGTVLLSELSCPPPSRLAGGSSATVSLCPSVPPSSIKSSLFFREILAHLNMRWPCSNGGKEESPHSPTTKYLCTASHATLLCSQGASISAFFSTSSRTT